eukprot:365917-Chlamydomonas_euryale.AAC.2
MPLARSMCFIADLQLAIWHVLVTCGLGRIAYRQHSQHQAHPTHARFILLQFEPAQPAQQQPDF